MRSSNGRHELRKQLESYSSLFTRTKSLTSMASSVTPFASGLLYTMSTCPRNQEHILMPMTVSSLSGNKQTSPFSLYVQESIHPCKKYQISIQRSLHWRKWTMNYTLWLWFVLWGTYCYNINLLFHTNSWHPWVTATVSLPTYDYTHGCVSIPWMPQHCLVSNHMFV